MMHKLRAHPDLGGESWTAAHLNAAYETLSDPEDRAAYDLELLSRYDIATLSEGRAKPGKRARVKEQRTGENSRSYYRILQVQRDAPLEILEASYRALCASNTEDKTLLDEAMAMLGDGALRSTYDRLLTVCDHQGALARMRLEFQGTCSYQPLITSYCTFCKRPHEHQKESQPDARCTECVSPLFPPPEHFLGLARRELTRVSRADKVTLYFDWPSLGYPGQVTDLSPTGMSCETAAPLDLNDVVKISSNDFDAIGSVAHLDQSGSLTIAGMRFLTVRFPVKRGTFKSIKV